jgi:putative DNA primase/helicase
MTAPNFDAIPQELKALPQWVMWRREDRKGKPTKVPYTSYGSLASSIDPLTWSAFEIARKAYEKGGYDGLGFVFVRELGLTAIDLDHCRDPTTGEIDDWALTIINRFNSYTEVSPSGEGVHILVKGSLPTGVMGRKKYLKGNGYRPGAAIEMYSGGRYFTMTGDSHEP